MGSSSKINQLTTGMSVKTFSRWVFIFALFGYSTAHSQNANVEELIKKQEEKKGYYIEEATQTWEIKSGGKEAESTQYFKYIIIDKRGWKEIQPIVILHSEKLNVDQVEITVEKGSDKPKKYEKKDLLDAPAYASFELYSDRRMLVLNESFEADKGAVTVSYRLKESQPVLSRQFFVHSEVSIKKSSIAITVPENWTIQSAWRNSPPEGESRPAPNVFRWNGTDIQPLLEEVYSPPSPELARQVMIQCLPPEKDPNIWAFNEWDDLAAWFQRLYLPQASATPEMNQAALAAVQGANTRLEKIRCLYDLVREQVRYVAVEIGIGGYQPYPASQTFEKKYGDCKDKATLLCTLLKSVDIEAYPVLVRTRNMGRLARDFPSPFQFNHCIAYVPASQYLEQSADVPPVPEVLQDGIFLDATSNLCPFGDLPPPDQDTWGLIVRETGGELKKIPSKWLQPNKIVRTTRIQLQANGNANCSIVEQHYGIENQRIRWLLHGKKRIQRQEYWSKKLNKYFPRSKPSELNFNNREELSLPLEIQCNFSVQKFSQRSGSLLIFPTIYWKIFLKNPFTEKIRIHPILLGSRPTEVDTLFIALPYGYIVDALPAETRVSEPFGEFVTTFESRDPRSVTVIRSCRFTRAEIPLEQYDAFRDFIDMLMKKEAEGIVLKKS